MTLPEAGPERYSVATATSLTAAGMMAMNVLVYLFTLAASRMLGPEQFGGVSAFLGVLMVANVGALALQATAARRIATSPPERRDEVAHDVIVSTWHVALGLGVLFTLATPLFMATLHTPLLASLMVGLTVGPLTMIGGYVGVLQGSEHWRWLAVTFIAIGVGRAGLGILGVVTTDSVNGAMVGVFLGALVPALIGWWGCRHVPHKRVGTHHGVLKEVWHNGHSLLAFFIVTNLDVLIARNQFSHFDSGVYAAGSILTKTCLFLPQFVIIVAFPKMAQDHAVNDQDRAWLKPLAAVAALGACATAGCFVLRDLAVTFVGGSEYESLASYAWLFTLEGTVFAVLQMVVYRQIARQSHVAIWLWASAVVIGALGIAVADENRALVGLVIAVVAVAALPVLLAKPSGRAAIPSVAPTPGG
ncbi:MAG TPA: oligosaccharide flippase family protein [Nocardioidaceae bacterium]|nr:oligosaccharide flippase family protein [Nocardioidaceae bacterium]